VTGGFACVTGGLAVVTDGFVSESGAVVSGGAEETGAFVVEKVGVVMTRMSKYRQRDSKTMIRTRSSMTIHVNVD